MLNHGSFGACPQAVLQQQQWLRTEMEEEPVRFFTRQMQPLLDESRRALAELVGADAGDLVFVRNVTEGVNSVLRSLTFHPGDELLITNHAYNACRNVVEYVAGRTGAKVVVASIPAPVESPQQVIAAVTDKATSQTRLAVVDHLTSPTGVIFPVEEIVHQLHDAGVDTLVDGAHAPGVVSLSLRRIRPAYYVGACHKWLCAPKGAAFLYVRTDRQSRIQPAVISHGLNVSRPGRSRFQDAFDWSGTDDPTPWLCVGEAIRFLSTLSPEGIEGLMKRNHQLAMQARRMLCATLGLRPVCPEEMVGSLAAIHLPDDLPTAPPLDTSTTPTPTHRLSTDLLEQYGIEVPVYHWPSAPQKLLRISAQAYNSLPQYEQLARALARLL
jgi:isopenicillin-N epimerase